MSLLRRKRYERKIKQYLLMPVCRAIGHKFSEVTVFKGTQQQRIYTNGCLRCHAAPPVSEERGLERQEVA